MSQRRKQIFPKILNESILALTSRTIVLKIEKRRVKSVFPSCFLIFRLWFLLPIHQVSRSDNFSDHRFYKFRYVITNFSKSASGRNFYKFDMMMVFWMLNWMSDLRVSQSGKLLNVMSNRSFIHLVFRPLLSDYRANVQTYNVERYSFQAWPTISRLKILWHWKI